MTHVFLLFELLLRILLDPGYFCGTRSAARSLLTLTWVPAWPDTGHLDCSVPPPLLPWFLIFPLTCELGLRGAGKTRPLLKPSLSDTVGSVCSADPGQRALPSHWERGKDSAASREHPPLDPHLDPPSAATPARGPKRSPLIPAAPCLGWGTGSLLKM